MPPLPSPPPQTHLDAPSAAPDTVIEDGDGGGGIVVAAGAAGGATAVVLGLVVICLLRRRKQKRRLVTLQSSNGASSSTLQTTVNKITLDTGSNVASGSASLHVANLALVWPPSASLPTTEVEVHLDLKEDQLQPPVSRASSPAGAARSSRDDDPRKAQRAAIEAAVAAAEDSEASEADEVQKERHSPQPRNKWLLGGSPGHKPILYSSEI
jgi:hypothetical protein